MGRGSGAPDADTVVTQATSSSRNRRATRAPNSVPSSIIHASSRGRGERVGPGEHGPGEPDQFRPQALLVAGPAGSRDGPQAVGDLLRTRPSDVRGGLGHGDGDQARGG